MRLKGLEPPRLSAPDPKSGAATNYATAAYCVFAGAKIVSFLDFTKFPGKVSDNFPNKVNSKLFSENIKPNGIEKCFMNNSLKS